MGIEIIERITRLEEKAIAAKDALKLADASMSTWQLHSNQVRDQILEERVMFCTASKGESMSARLDMIEKYMNRTEGYSLKGDKTWAMVVVFITVIIALAEIFIRLIKI